MDVQEVPTPAATRGRVLVRNAYSVISAGTEGKTVKDARLGYVGKARAREKEVKQVIESVKTQGLKTTYDRVMTRLETPSTLGYSCAGYVVDVGPEVSEFKVGDRVACGGVEASHSEFVNVPRNLCVKVPEEVRLEHAAFATIGSIAIQGIRQAELGVGATCAVIGLGLVGQLAAQILGASGVRTIGIDLDERQVERAREAGIDLALNRNAPGLEDVIMQFTRGLGVDAVIICAGTASTDPVDLAGVISRHKGRVIIVGNVPTGFQREHYYRKELDLRMSCSYGPGRYDSQYEEKGIDYPAGYVRWTENRNMQAFVDLLAKGRLHLETVITHVFDFVSVPDAYNMIVEGAEDFAGILVRYSEGKIARPAKRLQVSRRRPAASEVRIGMIGAGSFAQNVLLPKLSEHGNLVGVATSRPNVARYIAEKFRFSYCTTSAQEVLDDDEINVVFVATRHDSHAHYVIETLRRDKHVFVEKPLCIVREDLDEITKAYESSSSLLMVGFNRRFSGFVRNVKDRLTQLQQPAAINLRINAGTLNADHWVHDPEVGGGRILGEVCHFVDLLRYLQESPITHVFAQTLDDSSGLSDSLSVAFGFANGGVATLAYFSNGAQRFGKERIEVFCGGEVAVIDDFLRLDWYGGDSRSQRTRQQDKGHAVEIESFLDAIRLGGTPPIPFQEITETTRATFAVVDSIRAGVAVCL